MIKTIKNDKNDKKIEQGHQIVGGIHMKQFRIKPAIVSFDTVAEFSKEYEFTEQDLLFISNSTYEAYFKEIATKAIVVNYRKYGKGEPTDLMVEGIYADIKDLNYTRVIAVGGGTILDVAKLFALKTISPVVDLFEKKLPIEKDKELILIPTTCGTGSEVTNISILELTAIHTKMGLAVEELFADQAVLIPELLSNLPFEFFATSSIDALIHSIESYTSPKASEFSKIFSKKAMEFILKAYQDIAINGKERKNVHIKELLTASTYAGIAFSNAGCAAVHAMSYPLGATYHVAHGEANYAMFTGVYKAYQKKAPLDGIDKLNTFLAEILDCDKKEVYERIEELLNHILQKKPLKAYGVTKENLTEFTNSVMTKQQRLMANNYVPLSEEEVYAIYQSLYEG